MKRIFAASDVLYAAKVGGGQIANLNELDLLATGALAVYHEDGLVDVTAPDFTDIKEFYIAMGLQTSDVKVLKSSNIIRREARVEKCDFAAAVNERQFVGNDGATGALNFPATLVAGTSAMLNIFLITNESFDTEYPPFRFEYVLGVGETNATVLAGVKALIDAKIAENDPRFPITAVAIVAGNVGLRFDVAYGMKIQIGRDGIFANSTIIKDGTSNSLQMFIGQGLGQQIADLEEEYSDMRGNTNKVYMPQKFFGAKFNADTTINYDCWVITWYEESNNTHEKNEINRQTLIIAIPDSPATFVNADWVDTMEAAFDLTQPIEEGE